MNKQMTMSLISDELRQAATPKKGRSGSMERPPHEKPAHHHL
jgi:hypothetical protein